MTRIIYLHKNVSAPALIKAELCTCADCQELYNSRRLEIHHELTTLANMSGNHIEQQRDMLIDELARLPNA